MFTTRVDTIVGSLTTAVHKLDSLANKLKEKNLYTQSAVEELQHEIQENEVEITRAIKVRNNLNKLLEG